MARMYKMLIILILCSFYFNWSCDSSNESDVKYADLIITATDENNQPLSDVDVRVVNTTGHNLKTDTSGKGHVAGLQAITTNVAATKSEYSSYFENIILKEGRNLIDFQLLPIEGLEENFEMGQFGQNWNFSGDAIWIISTDHAHSGIRSAKSGVISHGQSTLLELTFDVESANMTMSFWCRVSSESCCDHLRYSIDNLLKETWSGYTGWIYYSEELPVGTHVFRWEYSKDGSVNSGDDCAWIDDVYIIQN